MITDAEADQIAAGLVLSAVNAMTRARLAIVLTDEDMADLPLATSRQIEILQFAPAHQVDPVMRARSYYIEPEPAGARRPTSTQARPYRTCGKK